MHSILAEEMFINCSVPRQVEGYISISQASTTCSEKVSIFSTVSVRSRFLLEEARFQI
jgi:hypothetical protein